MFEHVEEYVIRNCVGTGEGLGRYSEQAAESIHADFKKHWNNYKVLTGRVMFMGNDFLQLQRHTMACMCEFLVAALPLLYNSLCPLVGRSVLRYVCPHFVSFLGRIYFVFFLLDKVTRRGGEGGG